MTRQSAATILLVSLVTANCSYADTGKDKKKGWKGSLSVGITATSGNTRTKNINAKSNITDRTEYWRHHLHLSALNASSKGETTAERYFAKFNSRYSFTKHNYVFGLISYENNRFSGFHYNVTDTVGYGRRLIDSDTMDLDLEVGAGSREIKIIDSGTGQIEPQLHVGGTFEWDITDTTTFKQHLSSNIGKERSVSRSVTSLQTHIIGNLAASLSYTYEHTSKVPQGIQKTFAQASVNLVYNFF